MKYKPRTPCLACGKPLKQFRNKFCSRACEAKQKRGRPKSHGMSYTKTYKSWEAMKRRCDCLSDKSYARYGGRGIKYDVSWATFEGFYADMGDAPAGFTIERRNVNGNYEKGNCEWISARLQARNRSTSRFVTLDDVCATVAEHAERRGVKMRTLWASLKRAGAFEDGEKLDR